MAAQRSSTAKGRAGDPPAPDSLRGEAAWRAERDAIAARNERASTRARERQQQEYEALVARRRVAELRERAALAERHRP